MYENAIVVHSLLRLCIVVLCVVVAARGLHGWLGGRPYGPGDRTSSLLLVIAVDLQFVVGLGMYTLWSPLVQSAMQDFGAAMKDPERRRWAVEHPTIMLGAIVVVHLGRIVAKRAVLDVERHRWIALTTIVALLLFVVGSVWPLGDHTRPFVRWFGAGP